MKGQSRFNSVSALTFRYRDEECEEYLGENGFTRAKLSVELALVIGLSRLDFCTEAVAKAVEIACSKVTTEEVYREEQRIKHDIKALVNCICKKLRSKKARSFVHWLATSYDIIGSANAVRYRHVVEKVLIPSLLRLMSVLISITIREADTVQIGRTHGQHAIPITFGFAIAEYISRLGGCIEELVRLAAELRGKFSGAVGAYNASSLFLADPKQLELVVLGILGLDPADHATQIVSPEPMTRLLSEATITAGVMANLARDMRQLQRTEIGEVREAVVADQVGSSAMPHKKNPISLENIESMGKIVVPRMITVYLDQVSEHQRDLTNSASARTYGEIVCYVVLMAKRLATAMEKLEVRHENMKRNLAISKGIILAEPLQNILSQLGCPNAHEKVRLLTLQALCNDRPFEEVIADAADVTDYFDKMTPSQRRILSDPLLYTGIAPQEARLVANTWKEKLGL